MPSVNPSEYKKLSPADRDRLKSKIQNARSKMKSWSLNKLFSSNRRYRKDSEIRETGTAEILAFNVSKTKNPYLIVKAQTRGTKLWQQTLHFPSAIIMDKPSEATPFYLPTGNGNVVYIAPLTGDDPVLLRCSCPDYRHSFSWENHEVKSLQGRRIPYTKVAGSNRPPRNPDGIQGVCKHLRAVVHKLQDQRSPYKIIKPIRGSFSTSNSGYSSKVLPRKKKK